MLAASNLVKIKRGLMTMMDDNMPPLTGGGGGLAAASLDSIDLDMNTPLPFEVPEVVLPDYVTTPPDGTCHQQ